ncbi:MAG TPA: penicillin acylase family protein, partial [Spirochaetes bacterium]|nr:penicillin acylase family protein [Spirochaetota bacterium]
MGLAKKIIVSIVVVVAVLVVGGYVFVKVLSRGGLPDYNAKMVLKGLKGDVVVYRDRYAVPHIYAQNDDDLYMATGYVMAQDRLWQMDLLRRVTLGRLSEIFGEKLVDADLMFRSLRIPEKSKYVLSTLSPGARKAAEMFALGVNRFLEENPGRLPVEFKILGYKPEKWEAEHSANLIGYMAWDLSYPWS